ncbi:pectinesterase family protein [Streptacidiphilus monticola]
MSPHSRRQHRRSRTLRRVLAAAGALAVVGGGAAALPLFAGASTGTPSAARTLTVAADGSGQYRTVQAAVNAAAAGDTISIAKGTYHEVVDVPRSKTGLSLVGATGNAEDVVITYGNAGGTAKPGGGTYGTAGSATATFSAAGMTVRNLTITNSFSKKAHPEITAGQAVALNAQGDRQVYDNDRFIGHQDTLLAWSPSATAQTRQYFRSVFVKGDTDFIFGNATAVFDHANIQAIDDGAAAGGLNGFITAANTDASKKYGFLIADSTVSSTAAANTYYLGRPWHPSSTAVAQVVFRDTALPAAVKKASPWTDMGGFSWKSARFDSYADTGAGAAVNANSPQLTTARAADYTVAKYLAGTDGWAPFGTSGSTAAATAGATAQASTPAAATAGGSAFATATGDARTVTEPKAPATVCATVSSKLAWSGRTSSSANETTPPDTARIQRALDSCTQSGSSTVAVKLAASGSGAAFLSGPLTVHKGEVLLLDSGVTLYASRNPADYQVSGKPRCGTLSSGKGGCTAFLTVSGANAGIEAVRAASGSQGRIDGRGDQTILGTSTTWWGWPPRRSSRTRTRTTRG